MTGNVWPGGGACLTSAELALRHVNAREDILKDYKLDLTWRDSKVSTLIFFLGSHHREYLLIAFLCLIAWNHFLTISLVSSQFLTTFLGFITGNHF